MDPSVLPTEGLRGDVRPDPEEAPCQAPGLDLE